jgi:hypothetical protein
MSEMPTIMACVYGKPKKKKTSDMLATFPNALFIGVPSAITLVAQNELGFTPAVHPEPPQTLTELIALLEQVAESGSAEQYGAVVIDDASHLCKRSMLHWEATAPRGRSGKPDRFYPYQELSKHLLLLASMSRYLRCHMAMTFHERMPGVNGNGSFCPGGPDVPSRNQTEMLPSWCDINVRAMVDPTYPDPWFKGVYYVDPEDPEWVTGDRTGVCTRVSPANLREILRASHSAYRLDRLVGLEWQDDIAQQVSERMQDESILDVVKDVVAGKNDLSPLHLRWACQDGIARGFLNRDRSRGLFDFSVDEPAQSTGGSTLPPPPPTK